MKANPNTCQKGEMYKSHLNMIMIAIELFQIFVDTGTTAWHDV